MNKDNQIIQVLKASGEKEPFDEKKVLSSLARAGARPQMTQKILNQLKPQLYDGIPTHEIYHHVFKILNELKSSVASKYHLKRAIMTLGPSGYPFERFVAGILRKYGYHTKNNLLLNGKCVSHEIDVLAEKEEQKYMLECKFHHRPGIKTSIKTALYTYARLLDLTQYFDQAWLVTNTKTTTKVLSYAACVGLKVTTWNYPPHESLRQLIAQSGLYPITCLNSLSQAEKKILLEEKVVFCHDLLRLKSSRLGKNKLQMAQSEAEKIVNQQ